MLVRIDFSDGRYTMKEAKNYPFADQTIEIDDRIWQAYQNHLLQDKVYQSLIEMLDEKREQRNKNT